MSEPSDSSGAALWIILASATLTVMAGAILGPIVPRIQSELGVSESLAGLIITTHGILIVVVSPVAGVIIDRIGPRKPYIAGLLLYAVGGGAGLVVHDFLPLLASRVVLGVGVAFVYSGITVLIYNLYQGRRMDRALGLRSSANSLGAAVWPLVGGALGAVSWNAPFGVYTVALPLGLLAIVTVPETGHGAASESQGGSDAGLTGRLVSLVGVFRRRPAILAVYLLYFGTNLFLYLIVVFYPQLLEGVGITSSVTIGLYLGAQGAAGGVSAATYDRLKRRASGHLLVAAAFACWVAAFGLAAVVGSAAAAVAPVVLFGLGVGLVFPSTFGWIEALAPADRQGSLSSYIATVGYLGQFLSPLVFGPIVATFGVETAFALSGGVAGTALLVLGVTLFGRRDDARTPT